jgi:hypothetical protein
MAHRGASNRASAVRQAGRIERSLLGNREQLAIPGLGDSQGGLWAAATLPYTNALARKNGFSEVCSQASGNLLHDALVI